MRLYSFSNFYLSSIQQGIQTGHLSVDLVMKYINQPNTEQHNMVVDWANNHKTYLCMNGGNNNSLQELKYFLEHPDNPYPFHHFCEDEQSLGGVLTSVGIILPEEIYLVSDAIRSNNKRDIFYQIDSRFRDPNTNKIWYCSVYLKNQKQEFMFSDWEYKLIFKLIDARFAS